jgi:hypothetical protein
MKEGIFNQKFDKKNDLKSCSNGLKNIISQTKIYNPLIIGKIKHFVQLQIPASRVGLAL